MLVMSRDRSWASSSIRGLHVHRCGLSPGTVVLMSQFFGRRAARARAAVPYPAIIKVALVPSAW